MKSKQFTVSEHRPLRVKDVNAKGETFTELDLAVLVKYYGSSEKGLPYFSLGHNCVWFCEYVGVLQIGHLTIEVLPKVDDADNADWQKRLIEILHTVHNFDVAVTGNANLTLKSNSILDYYFNLFLAENEKLLHSGLVKKYRNVETNRHSLKGKLLVGKQVTVNAVHKERFFVRHTTYDQNNVFNGLLYKTLKLIRTVSRNGAVYSNAAALILYFPELPDLAVSQHTFDQLHFDRKTEAYKPALAIARLLLLHFHPDIRQGGDNVLALMFDMNLLWERFVFVTLRKLLKDYTVKEQVPKPYWRMDGHRSVSLKPDIKLTKDGRTYIIDTKWKNIGTGKPGYADLQQMFAYTKYFSSAHTLLLYPGENDIFKKGSFYHETERDLNYPCSVGVIALKGKEPISEWQREISWRVKGYFQADKTKGF